MHTRVTNKSVEAENRARFNWWRWKLAEYFLSAYKWEGLPFDDNIYGEVERRLNLILLETGKAGFCYDGDYPIIGQVTASDAVTWWGGSYRYTITTCVGSTVSKDKSQVAICYNTPLRRSMFYTIDHYAQTLVNIDRAFDVNITSQNTPIIIRSPKGQELTYSNIFEQIAGHKPVVYGRENTFEEDTSPFWLQPGVYVADKLELQHHDILNDFFFEIGVTSKTVEKKAQLISDEINIDRESISLAKNSLLDCRQSFCDQMKRLFGFDVKCKLNVDSLPQEYSDVSGFNSGESSLSGGGADG